MTLQDLTMADVCRAMQIDFTVNTTSSDEVARWFEQQTGIAIPAEVITEFAYSGLSPIYLLQSDFLNQYGIENLIQHTKTKFENGDIVPK